uniref:Protein PAT1 homolog 1 n=1 Tax=Xenopus tropicalis TaxID=8364 RepID=A0A6I8QPD1_XENTR
MESLEDGDGFPDLEEDEEIDQFNDDTFGAGAVDDDWREEHERLAEMEEKLPASHILARVTSSPINDLLGDQQEELEQSLNQLVKENEEPALPQGSLSQISSGMNSSIWDTARMIRPIRGPLLMEVLCPNPIHIRASSPFSSHHSNPASILRHPFPSALSPLQRAQLLGGAQPAVAGQMSPSQFSRPSGLHGPTLASVAPKLLQGHVGQMMTPGGVGFRPFFGVPSAPGAQIKNMRSQQQFRPDTTHLHPQHRRMLYQRQQNRNQHRGVNGTGGERNCRPAQMELNHRDPYAGLMLQREKEWVCRIQLLQLQSTDPYHDDYYYQNYFEKLGKLSVSQDRSREGPKKERTKLITPQVAKLEHAYKPVQFEGSLGKLTVSSVNNPRKMIDAVATSRSDEDETREKQVRDKKRQTLVTIEKMFSLLLDLEDFERRFTLCCEEAEQEVMNEERKQKLQQLCDTLRGKEVGERVAEEQFVQIMCIRKGKRMIARILPLLPLQLAAAVLSVMAHNLLFLIKKDLQDQVLQCLAAACSLVLCQLSLPALISLLQNLCGTTSQHQLSFILQNKFGLTLLYQILERGEELLSSEESTSISQPAWTSLVVQAAHCLLQVSDLSLPQPLCSPLTALTHFSRYLDTHNSSLLQSKLGSTTSTL